MEFSNCNIVVTGGTGALGTATVEWLSDRGAACYVPSHGKPHAWPLAGRSDVHVIDNIDLTREEDVRRLYQSVPPLWASIQVAGGFQMAPLEQTSGDSFMDLFRLNALTCFLCCREAATSIRRRPADGAAGLVGGRLVNVAARPALEPRTGAGMAAYAASKAAIVALTGALGEELAKEQIWVNAIAPSILDTPANRAAMPSAPHHLWPSVGAVAKVIADLASPANACVRSGTVPVYGGV